MTFPLLFTSKIVMIGKRRKWLLQPFKSFIAGQIQKLFSPTDFDLIIADESHRAIGGNSRAVWVFYRLQLGLTATPEDYLKMLIRKTIAKDPRAWENGNCWTLTRLLVKIHEPIINLVCLTVFAVDLVNPLFQTHAQTSRQNYFLKKAVPYGRKWRRRWKRRNIFHKDFEKKFFPKDKSCLLPTFLKIFKRSDMERLQKYILHKPKHASKSRKRLIKWRANWPENNSDLVQITSNISIANNYNQFANNNLSGHTKFLENYNQAKRELGNCWHDDNGLRLPRYPKPCAHVRYSHRLILYRSKRNTKVCFWIQTNMAKPQTRKNNFKLWLLCKLRIFWRKVWLWRSFAITYQTKRNRWEDLLCWYWWNRVFNPDKSKHSLKPHSIEGMKVDRKLFEKAREELQMTLK